MDNELGNSFDASIKNALQNHQVPYDDSTWGMLEGKMKAAELSEDATLDQMAKKALGDYKVPYDHSTWTALSKKLDRINYRNRLIVAKFFEAAVIFFAVFTMVKFLGNIPEVKDYLPIPFAQSEKHQIERLNTGEMLELSSLSGSDEDKSSKVAIAKGENVKDGINQAATLDIPVEKLSPAKNLSNATSKDLYQDKALMAIRGALSQRAGIESNHRSDRRDVTRLDLRDAYLAPVIRSIEAQHTSASVPLLPEYSLSMITAETATDFHVVAVERVPKVVTRFNLFYQYNVHRIENVARRLNSYNQTEYSKGIGFAANVQFGNVGFDLGAVYDQVQYDAAYDRNEIHKIQIPLNLRYSGFRTKYADFYMKGGASVHGISQAHYEAPVDAAPSAPGTRTIPPYLNDGLLNDGNKVDNIYFTANLGGGLDVSMTKSFSLFAEAVYQHRFKGEIGLTKDKFNTFATNLGVSYTFK